MQTIKTALKQIRHDAHNVQFLLRLCFFFSVVISEAVVVLCCINSVF